MNHRLCTNCDGDDPECIFCDRGLVKDLAVITPKTPVQIPASSGPSGEKAANAGETKA